MGKNEGQLIMLQRKKKKNSNFGRYAGIIHCEPDSE